MQVRSLSSGLALVTALAVIVACGPTHDDPDYGPGGYCDSTGCYTCDGYGCRPNGSSSGSSGVSSSSGSSGAPKCTTPTSCGVGQACVSGACVACGGDKGPCPCAADAQCGTGNVCQAGACTPKANVCQFASECGADQVCADGQCVASCASVSCASGSSCVKGACVPDQVGMTCADDSACSGATPKCVSGRCTAACTNDSACSSGQYCNQGACVPDTRPKPNCASDAQCSGGGGARTCQGGFCRYMCSTDAACRAIDSRIGYCSAGVCRTSQEANPECVRKSDCSGGKNCVNNLCL
jgi:hypothetical protein